MPRNRGAEAIVRARGARQAPSVAERIVREALRGSRLGFKFRREHPLGAFRLDFYCAEARLAVERDGEPRETGRDALRDAALASLGIRVHRLPSRRFFSLDPAPCHGDLAELRRLCEKRSGRGA